MKEIKRGEIYSADFGAGFGSEQGGTRPSLILQNDIGNKHSPTTIVAAITGRKTNVDIDLSKGIAELYFANPTKSNQDMVLQIVIKDVVIAQSGTISPGKQISRLDLLKEAPSMLSAGGYDGSFKVLYYQPDTHEKTIVNTEIPVHITVK